MAWFHCPLGFHLDRDSAYASAEDGAVIAEDYVDGGCEGNEMREPFAVGAHRA
jgi:hypothetical protein